jgi:transcriptional regulator with GAF, ATPase, and Fis domain
MTNVRVIGRLTAISRPLWTTEAFRSDLFHRLNVSPISYFSTVARV